MNVIKEVLKDSVLERKIEPSEVLVDIIQNVPLLIKEGSSYKWIHKSFMEYFAAKYIAIDPDKVQFLENLWENQFIYLDDFSNLLTIYSDIDKKTFNDIFVKRLLEDFINYMESEELTENEKIIKQLNFHREFLLIKEKDVDYRLGEVFAMNKEKLSQFLIQKYSKWLVNEDINYILGYNNLPTLFEGKTVQYSVLTILANIKSFYNLDSLLAILSAKGYPFVKNGTRHILPTDKWEIFNADYALEVSNWDSLHTGHNLIIKGTEAEANPLFIARTFRDLPTLNYDEAKSYLEKLQEKQKKSILSFMRKAEKN
ncbi:hypothetical protein CN574_01625 [Bacillus toyonensis]|nr:hypothetical protein CON60_26105 [Bacillus toyonensis]PEP68471.1 hypothetical protein CN574_01625 [Bacillus toyonensis]